MKRRMFVLAAITVLATGFISPVASGTKSIALGQSSFQAEWGVFVYFQASETPVAITDPGGALVGEGSHRGQLLCNNRCSHQTQLEVNGIAYQYRFEVRQALDPDAGVVVVSGRGTLSDGGQKERFSFTATVEDNRDGTVWVRYDASRPDASFVVPETPGIFALFSKP